MLVPVDRHGIVADSFRLLSGEHFHFDSDAKWIEAEPLWAAAERQGVRTAVFFWIGSQTDWHGVGATYRRTPFDSSVGEEKKVGQILTWLDLPLPQTSEGIRARAWDTVSVPCSLDPETAKAVLIELRATLLATPRRIDGAYDLPHLSQARGTARSQLRFHLRRRIGRGRRNQRFQVGALRHKHAAQRAGHTFEVETIQTSKKPERSPVQFPVAVKSLR